MMRSGAYTIDARWWVAGVVGVLPVAHAFWILTAPAGQGLQPWFANLFIDASHALATVLVLTVAFRYRGTRVGLGWSLVGLGLIFGQFGESSWSFQELVLGREVPFPSVSDIGYVGAYIPVFVGLLLMPLSPLTGSGRVKLTLDTLILMSALAIISWRLIIGGVLAHSDAGALTTGLSVFYPFADLGIIFAAFIIVARAGRSVPGIAFALLGAGYATNAFSDSLYIYLAQAGYETGNLIDIGWMVGNSLIALGALVRLAPVGLRSLAHPHDAAPSFWPSLIPYVPLLPLSVLLIRDVSAGEPALLVTAGIMIVIGLIVLRQILALHEESRLNHELAALSALLETKVKEKTMEMLRRDRSEAEPLPPGQRPNGADEPVGGLGHLSSG